MTMAYESFLFSYTFENTVKGTNRAAIAAEKFGQVDGVYAHLLDHKEYNDPTIFVYGESKLIEEVAEMYGRICVDYGVTGVLCINWGLVPIKGCITATFNGQNMIMCVTTFIDSVQKDMDVSPLPHTGFVYYNTEKRVRI